MEYCILDAVVLAYIGISGFQVDPHFCQLPVAEEVQPDRNRCPGVLTVVWIELDSNYTLIPGKPLIISMVEAIGID